MLFPEILSVTRKMTDEQFGVLMRAAFSYRLNGEAYSGDDMVVDMAFQVVANQIDRHQEYCSMLANNAKGNKGEQKAAKHKQRAPPFQSISDPSPFPSIPDESEPGVPAQVHFSPPSVEEVQAYCTEQGYSSINPRRFISYYAARQWKVGQTRITDWKAAADSWYINDVDKGSSVDKMSKTQIRDDSLDGIF